MCQYIKLYSRSSVLQLSGYSPPVSSLPFSLICPDFASKYTCRICLYFSFSYSLIRSASPLCCQSYQWLKEKIVSEDGRKQQAKLKELNHIAEKLGCTLPQLAVGKTFLSYSKYCGSSLKQSFETINTQTCQTGADLCKTCTFFITCVGYLLSFWFDSPSASPSTHEHNFSGPLVLALHPSG